MKKKIIHIGPDLFTAFVEKELAEYKQPERKGVPKGERVGLSKKKFEVSLYMLTNLLHKDIKDKTGVSESLIRKWRTEDDFRKQMEKNIKHFAAYVVNAILRLNDINLGYLAMYYDRPGKEDYTAKIDNFESFLPDGSPQEIDTLVKVEPLLNLDILTDEAKTEILRQIARVNSTDMYALLEFRKAVLLSLLKDSLSKDKDWLLVDLYTSLVGLRIAHKEVFPLLTKVDRTPKETEFLVHMMSGMSIWVKEMAASIVDTFKQDTRFEKVLETIGREE